MPSEIVCDVTELTSDVLLLQGAFRRLVRVKKAQRWWTAGGLVESKPLDIYKTKNIQPSLSRTNLLMLPSRLALACLHTLGP